MLAQGVILYSGNIARTIRQVTSDDYSKTGNENHEYSFVLQGLRTHHNPDGAGNPFTAR